MLSYALTVINCHANMGSECFVPRSIGGKEETLVWTAHPSSQGRGLGELLEPGAGSISGLPVLSLVSLKQIKSWKQLRTHPLWGPVPVPLFNSKHGWFHSRLASFKLRRAGRLLSKRTSSPPKEREPVSPPGLEPCSPLESLTLGDPSLPAAHGMNNFEGLRCWRGGPCQERP